MQRVRFSESDISRRHCLGRAKNPRHANYQRVGKDEARLLRGRDRLFRIRWQCRFMHRVALRGVKNGQAYFQAGAGIVADSNPRLEFEETVNKARAMSKALAMAVRMERTHSAK